MTANQNDFVIDNGTGFAVRTDIQDALQALAGNSSGDTEPSVKYSYQWWADTGSTPPVMKLRNSSNDGWITLFELDGTITLEDGSSSSPGLAFRSDTNTGLARLGTDKMALITGGINRLVIDANGLIGLNVDDPTAFSSDANNLVMAGNAATGITIQSSTTTTGNLFFADGTSGDQRFRGYVIYDHNADKLLFGSQGVIVMSAQRRIADFDQVRVGIGHDAAVAPLHVKTEGETMIKLETTDNPNSYVHFVNTGGDGGFIGYEHISSNAAGQKDNLVFYADNASSNAAKFMQLNSFHLEMMNGANIRLPNGSGIDFSLTAGTGSSELFDDYEEGGWSGLLNGGNFTATQQYFRYTKVGRMVLISGELSSFSSNTNSSNIEMTGAPYATETGCSHIGAINTTKLNKYSGYTNPQAARIEEGTTRVVFMYGGENGNTRFAVRYGDLNDTSAVIQFTIPYMTA